MLKTIKISNVNGGKKEIDPQEAIQIQHDSNFSRSFNQYVEDIKFHFEATQEEAEIEVKNFFKMK